MLYLVKGRAGSGKTNKIRQIIGEHCENTESKPLLIVPEQFSFESERAMLKFLGAKKLKKIDVLSFPRMALSNIKNSVEVQSRIASNGVKTALMGEALVQLDGRLEIFKNIRQNTVALGPLVDFSKELKYCCIDSDDLNDKIDSLNDCVLKDKIKELDLINNTYDALLSQSYFDDAEALSVFNEYAIENNFFKNKTVFLDSFRTFSKQELRCIDIILSQADNVYFSICVDENAKKFTSLYYMRELEQALRGIANKNNVSVSEIFCNQSEDAFGKDILTLEKNLYSSKKIVSNTSDGSVTVVKCKNSDDECAYIAATIKKMLRSGKYRCRDIAVIERTNGVYKSNIIEALRRLDIAVFDDSRRPLVNETLFVYLSSAIDCITQGFTTESLMCYLKSGLTSLSLGEISRLEKYALVWGVGSKQWQNDFTMNPDGFGSDFTEKQAKELEEINSIRKKAVLPLLSLKKKCDDKSGKEIAEAVYNFIIDTGVREKLYDLCISLEGDGFLVESERVEGTWDVLINILDSIANLFPEKACSLKRWKEIFDILVSSGDIGEIPQGLDEVTVGSADRIRIEKIKVAFLVGVNHEEFPLVNVQGGVLTDSDRVILTNLGLDVRPAFENTIDEERFIAYCAVTAASEKLYLVYKSTDSEGNSVSPSEIVDTALSSINDCDFISTDELDSSYYIESEDSAFSVYAQNYFESNELKATLEKYFENNELYCGKKAVLDRLNNKTPVKFDNPETSKKLFGENVYISASKVESFYNCPFAYFMRYGLKAEPLREAVLDPAQSGTIVHLVMEKVLKHFPKAEFINASDDEIKLTVSSVLKEYLDEKMGGLDEKSKRFMFLFNRLIDISMAIINRLKLEFQIGEFSPCDFELRIGGEEIPAYELPLNEGNVKVTGSVDRVDMMEKDGIKYLRVIDYKTGKKEFKLSELFDGLNIQMVLYLMALEKNGKSYYGDVLPAGVLYLPSRIGVSSYLDSRSPSIENVEAQKRVSGKLSGMVLDSPVVFNGMGVDKYPDYFPVSYKKDGSAKDNYYSLSQFKTLSKIIDKKIINMGESLHQGLVGAIPCGSDGEGKMCAYCSYKSICGIEKNDEINEITKLTHLKALERLDGEGDEQGMD